jgi:CO/xanthine dehydrogenase FAD-binding subunit
MLNVSYYARPQSIDEALDLLSEGDVTPIAGGTDVIVQLRHGGPRKLIDIGGLGLGHVRADGAFVEIGACVTHSTLRDNASVKASAPLLSRAAASVGTEQIRNRGTVGGNIVNASPSADTVPALLCHEAELVLVSKSGTRTVPIGEFISGPYLTVRRPDELLHSIRCKTSRPGARVAFLKLGRREAVNISRMTIAVYAEIGDDGVVSDARVSAGSAFPTACRLGEVEAMLRGNYCTEKLFCEAGALTSELMVRRTGVRWSTPYKKPVIEGLIERALREARGKVT